MSERPINGMLETTLEKIRGMVDVDMIVGEAIALPAGGVAVPVSKVSYGFAAGGSEFGEKKVDGQEGHFGGGSGAGVTLLPVAFLVAVGEDVKLLHVEPANNTLDRALDMAPGLIDKIGGFLKKKKEEKKAEKNAQQGASKAGQ